MGVDTVALLHIGNLPAPRTLYGELLVEHRGDASLLHTFNRFRAAQPDEHSLVLRRVLGASLDAHDDPRGILFFPDVCEPQGNSYEAIAAEASNAGVWAPKVGADHVPARYTGAPSSSHEAIVARLIEVMGRDEATVLDMTAGVNLLLIQQTNGRADAMHGYRESIARVTAALGEGGARLYEKSLRSKLDRELAALTGHAGRGRP
jgi:hypothetical protein